MLSRVADSFYWMSRYLERAEHAARVIDVHLGLTLDDRANLAGRSLLAAIGDPPTGFAGAAIDEAAAGAADERHYASVTACVVGARENARQIREQISAEMWEQLNRMYLLVRGTDRIAAERDPWTFLRAVVDGAYLFRGVTESTLSRGEGWHYLQLGRYIERATTTASMLEHAFADDDTDGPVARYAGSLGLLRATGAFEAYCRHYTTEPRREQVAEFLLLNPEFPRSVRFAVDRLEDSLAAVARQLGRPIGRPERFAGRLQASLNYGQIDEILADDLIRYVQSIRKQCAQVHAAVYQTYITYSIEAAIPR